MRQTEENASAPGEGDAIILGDDDWGKVCELFHAVLDMDLDKRAEYLNEQCSGNASLIAEVERLLFNDQAAGEFLSESAIDRAAPLFSAQRIESTIPEQVGPYSVSSQIGAGGMGKIYLAEDSRLKRTVALKVLPDAFREDDHRVLRFKQEARAASSLNHPNIITVFDIGQEADHFYIATEYVEGRNLRSVMSSKSLSAKEVLEIAVQMTSAIAAAHQAGIVHRDIKPENIMLRPDGVVKVLDFGIAKISRFDQQSDPRNADLVFRTNPGIILGTLQYMSPEQAAGIEVDARSDIFAIGVVLRELIRDSTNEEKDAAESLLSPILRKCVEHDREHRYQTTTELLKQLKNLQQESVRREVALHAKPSRRNRRRSITSLAVLPFINGSSDPSSDYLADGITESIINTLSQLSRLRVLSRTIVFRFKGRDLSLQEAGHELNVGAVLTGRTLQYGKRIIIRAELVDVRNGWQLWGAQYDRDLSNILAVQEEIAGEISEKLLNRLAETDRKRLARRQTQSAEAYRLFLEGRYHFNKRLTETFRKAVECFNQATQLDPDFALAYVGLSDCYSLMSLYGVLKPSEADPQAKENALKALSLDGSLAEAHNALGVVQLFAMFDWQEAEKCFLRAIALNPGYADAHQRYGLCLLAMQRFEESEAQFRKALDIDPLSHINATIAAYPYYYGRRFDRAIAQYRKVIEVEPTFSMAHFRLGLAYIQKGMYDEAFTHLTASKELSRDRDVVAALAYLHGLCGRREEALKALEDLLNQARAVHVSSYVLAIVHIGLGEYDEAIDYLCRAYQERSYWLLFAESDPVLDPLRSNSRFKELMSVLRQACSTGDCRE